MTRRSLSTMAVLACVAALSVTVLAHMKLSKTMPEADSTVTAAPAKVQMWFTEAPDKAVSKLTVTGPGGAVQLGTLTVGDDKSLSAAVEGSMGDGAYKVDWQSAGHDGHVQKGTFAFSVRRTR
ncbi:MAG: copper resistance protein CopC [Vicinamibacterales bacterium]